MSETSRGLALRRSQDVNFTIGKSFLFIIGIDIYDNHPNLNNAVRDAHAVRDLLLSKYQFNKENLFELYNEAATESSVLLKFKELIKKIGRNDTLLIYYSGHGFFDEDFDEGFWVSSDSPNLDTAHYITNSMLLKAINKIQSRHTFLISDSCFSGTVFSSGTRDIIAERNEKFKSRWALTSGRKEVVSDGQAGDHSPFTGNLLEVLRNNESDLLRASKLIELVTSMTKSNVHQTPVGSPLFNVGHQHGEYVFRLSKDEEAYWENVNLSNVSDAYYQYLKLYPNGKYRREAKIQMHALENQEALMMLWEIAQTEKTVEAYQHYVNEIEAIEKTVGEVEGHDKRKALKAIKEITEREEEKEQKAWDKVLEINKVEAYLDYIKLKPNSPFADDARAKADEIQNKAFYDKCVKIAEEFSELSNKHIPNNLEHMTNQMAVQQENVFNYTNDEFKPNDNMYGVIDALMLHRPEVALKCQSLYNNYENYNAPNIDTEQQTEVAKELIRTVYPKYPMGFHLRELLLDEDYQAGNRKRLDKIKEAYDSLLQLLIHVLLAQLWNEKIKNPRLKIQDFFNDILQDFLDTSAEEPNKFTKETLFVGLLQLFKANRIAPFMKEMEDFMTFKAEDLQNLLLETGSFFRQFEGLSLPSFDDSKDCKEAEFLLVEFFHTASFILKYEFRSVKNVEVVQDRMGKFIFENHVGDPNLEHTRAIGMFIKKVETEIPMPEKSVLIFRENDETHEYLNLSPFVIDLGSFYTNSRHPMQYSLYELSKKSKHFYRCYALENKIEEKLKAMPNKHLYTNLYRIGNTDLSQTLTSFRKMFKA